MDMSCWLAFYCVLRVIITHIAVVAIQSINSILMSQSKEQLVIVINDTNTRKFLAISH